MPTLVVSSCRFHVRPLSLLASTAPATSSGWGWAVMLPATQTRSVAAATWPNDKALRVGDLADLHGPVQAAVARAEDLPAGGSPTA